MYLILAILAQIILLVLKLTGVVGWSWVIITLPVWGSAAFVVAFTIFGLAIAITR